MTPQRIRPESARLIGTGRNRVGRADGLKSRSIQTHTCKDRSETSPDTSAPVYLPCRQRGVADCVAVFWPARREASAGIEDSKPSKRLVGSAPRPGRRKSDRAKIGEYGGTPDRLLFVNRQRDFVKPEKALARPAGLNVALEIISMAETLGAAPERHR